MKLQNKRMITVRKWGGFGIGSHYSDFDNMMGEREKIRNTEMYCYLMRYQCVMGTCLC